MNCPDWAQLNNTKLKLSKYCLLFSTKKEKSIR